MLTYVINTSENKTFDSDRLFDLAGYNRIRWMNCRLDNIRKYSDIIFDKQNVLGADSFRVVIIVDFYGFDRIRAPYGRNGYGEEKGVELNLYMPYIEAYLQDNFIRPLEQSELFAKEYEIYYVQNAKYEKFEHIDNAESQLEYILSGNEDFKGEDKVIISELADGSTVEEAMPSFGSFTLYCTPNISLEFNLAEYPYGIPEETMTFSQFFSAFRIRSTIRSQFRCHYYMTTYGNGPARAAFDTLTLSLYLVWLYEREEAVMTEGDFEVTEINAEALKDILETSWQKIAVARNIAESNNSKYFSLLVNSGEITSHIENEENTSEEEAIDKEKARIRLKKSESTRSANDLYNTVVRYANKTSNELDDEQRKELDSMMSSYLRKRDETSEVGIEVAFDELMDMGALTMTEQCPSKEQFDYIVEQREREISSLFDKVLKAQYINMDYSKVKERADKAYIEYNKLAACARWSIISDILFMIVSVLSFLIPYHYLQLDNFVSSTVKASTLFGISCGVFAGLFAIAVILQAVLLSGKMRKQKKILIDCFITCKAMRNQSFSHLKKKYEFELIRIEEARYEIRQLANLYDKNMAIDKNIMCHRLLLEELYDKLSSMLNNLGVEPKMNNDISLRDEFDISKPLYARENAIYQIFSIETIEKMFPKKKGSDGK